MIVQTDSMTHPPLFRRLREWAGSIKRDVVALWLAAGEPRVPWYAKVVAAFVAGYALSPIDLIPDFVPIIGYLDDLLIVPLGIWAAEIVQPILYVRSALKANRLLLSTASRADPENWHYSGAWQSKSGRQRSLRLVNPQTGDLAGAQFFEALLDKGDVV